MSAQDVAQRFYGLDIGYRSKPMAQTLESVNAFSSAQAEINFQPVKKRRSQKFLKNAEWNILMRRVFRGENPVALESVFGVSNKTIYHWRRLIVTNQPIPRFSLEDATKEVISKSRIKYRDEGTIKDWKPTVKETTMEEIRPQAAYLNNMIRNGTSHLQEAVAQLPAKMPEHETLLIAPSGNRLLTPANDAQLMLFLKSEGFELYQVSLSKI
jgi:hypothetical protein